MDDRSPDVTPRHSGRGQAVSGPSAADLERGRAAYERRQWEEARAGLLRADEAAPLGPADLWRLAVAAFLTGREDEYVAGMERAHRGHLDAGDPATAARAAVWLGLHLADRGEMARASGWFGRAGRLLEAENAAGGVEAGYLLLPAALQALGAGDAETAYGKARGAAHLGQRFGDPDLLALGVHLQGRARLSQARVEEGLALLDEAMIAVAGGELSPVVTGLIYCSMIGACRSVHAVARAHEWTEALAEWCERQPDMVAYTGECSVYRAELLQMHGAWSAALEEARRAGDRLPEGAAAHALAQYQEGETLRLLGELDAAEAAYRAASRAGREPQPGLALLRLARGDADAAAAAIRRALAENPDPLRRARLLPAHVEIMLAAGATDEAREASRELASIAASYASRALATMAAQARGAVALAGGDARGALPDLRRAVREWLELDAPYEAARARVLMATACRALEDEDGAALELGAARTAFETLGAGPDLERVDRLIEGLPDPAGEARDDAGGRSGDTARRQAARRHGLTPRELEVLALVATGRTNRAIAEALFISEKTVARHLSNIFTKLDVSTRTAATAFAYEHGLLDASA